MKNSRLWISFCVQVLILSLLHPSSWAQKGERYRDLVTVQVNSDKLAPPEHLRNYLVEGKLRLSLRDAVILTLENNSFVRIQETQVESSKFALLGAHSPFDPLLTSSYNVNSSTSPPFSALQGTGQTNVNNTAQNATLNYSETFESGTNVQAGFTSNNNFTNNSNY